MDKTVDKYLQQEYSTYTMKKQKQHITKEQWDLDVGFSVGKYDLDKQSFKEEKLCDALWEAVKYKLK